jgi:hypothetical protein
LSVVRKLQRRAAQGGAAQGELMCRRHPLVFVFSFSGTMNLSISLSFLLTTMLALDIVDKRQYTKMWEGCHGISTI